ncbi:MAG: hypothetical protein KF691_13915 [Phycisphaeraceae bacterium]|nr:hypothetical protein [Phycisphaeraceae bacterium]
MSPAEQLLQAVDRSRRWLLLAAAALALASFSPHWRITPDSAVFLGIARNLAAGRGFTFNGETVTSVNAGFPYLLALVPSFESDPIVGSHVLIMTIGLAALVLVYLLITRHAGRPLAVLITVLTAVNGTFLRHACEILADVPFFFCCTLALLGYELTFPSRSRADDATSPAAQSGDPHRILRLSLAAALVLIGLAGMASLRIVFLGPLAAICVDLLWRLRRSRFKWALVAGAAAVLLAAVAIRLADPRMENGFTLLSKERELLHHLTNFSETWTRIVSFNAPQLFFDVAPRAIFGNKLGLWPVDGAITLAVFAAGTMLFRRRIAWGMLVVIYVVQWLVIFPDSRYFLPVLPLLLLGWWDLSLLVVGRIRLSRQRAALAAMLALIAIPNAVRSVGFAIEQHHHPFLERYLRGRFQDLPELAARARESLPPDAVVITDAQFAAPLHYFSGLRTIPTIGPTLLTPLPKDQPVFALLPTDAGLDAALKALKLKRAGEVITGPDRGPASTLKIIAVH